MYVIKNSTVIAVLLIITLCYGCSSDTIVSNSVSSSSNPLITQTSSLTDAESVLNFSGVLGLYELSIDKSAASIEMTSKRALSIGESFIVSGAGFFTASPCNDCFRIRAIGLTDDNNIAITFAIKHPFEAGDPLKPPTGINRLDLDLFDLALVIEPINVSPFTFPLANTDIFNSVCVAPDGYTKEFEYLIEPNNAVLPYYLVVDESEMAPLPDPTTWNKFAMGASTDFTAIFNLSGINNMSFNLYLTTGYGESARKSDRLIPKYYNPEFNRKSAWKVVVTPPQGEDPPAIGNTWRSDDTTTPFSVKVEVYDWQIGAPVYTGYIYEEADPGEIYAASSPSGIEVEILGMNNSLQSIAAPDNPLATGRPGDPWIFSVPIANENGLPEGQYPGLVKVIDERLPASDARIRDFLIHLPGGGNRIDYIIPEYATYQVFTASVVVGEIPGVGNVWITVNRYEVPPVPRPKGEAFEPTRPWTLQWDSFTGAQEYAIYYDNDPGNYNLPTWDQSELTDNLVFVGTTSSTTYDVPPSHLPDNHYVIGNTYVVRARTVAGDPGSELADSEPAFIMTNGWETTPAVHSPILDPALFEGWQAGWEMDQFDPDPWHFYYYICTDDYPQNVLQGAKSARVSSCMVGKTADPYPGRWNTITHRTPVVPNAPVRFLDCALQQWSTPDTNPVMGGLCVGTCSEPRPLYPWSTPSDFEWALVSNTAPFDGYNNNQDTFLRNTFDDVHTDASWCWYTTDLYTTDTGWRVGCDLNATADPNDPYIGFGGAREYYYLIHANWFADDIAIMIY